MVTNSQSKAVCVIDDDDAVRDSIKALLDSVGYVVKTFPDALSFLESYEPEQVRCALLDVRMPVIDGIELLKRLAVFELLPPIVIITGHGDVEMAVKAMKIGAFDFIEKPFEPDALIERVGAAVRWGEDQSAERYKVDEAKDCFATLTPRETDVVKHLLAGQSNKAIAKQLSLSPRTVEVHRAHIMEKTKTKSFSHLVRLAVLAGVDPDDHERE